MHKSKMQAISIVNLDCKEKKRFFRDHQLEECSLMSRALLQHVCEISERKIELVDVMSYQYGLSGRTHLSLSFLILQSLSVTLSQFVLSPSSHTHREK